MTLVRNIVWTGLVDMNGNKIMSDSILAFHPDYFLEADELIGTPTSDGWATSHLELNDDRDWCITVVYDLALIPMSSVDAELCKVVGTINNPNDLMTYYGQQ